MQSAMVFFVLVLLGYLPFHLAEAQQPKKVPRIGFLTAISSASMSPVWRHSGKSARARISGREKYCYWVSLCRGKTRSSSYVRGCACASQGKYYHHSWCVRNRSG